MSVLSGPLVVYWYHFDAVNSRRLLLFVLQQQYRDDHDGVPLKRRTWWRVMHVGDVSGGLRDSIPGLLQQRDSILGLFWYRARECTMLVGVGVQAVTFAVARHWLAIACLSVCVLDLAWRTVAATSLCCVTMIAFAAVGGSAQR
jgi:hypothetical protein